MNLQRYRHLVRPRHLSGRCLRLISVLSSVLLAVALTSGSTSSTRVPLKKDVLILNEVGFSHALSDLVTQQIVSGVRSTAGMTLNSSQRAWTYFTSLTTRRFPKGRIGS